MQTENKGESTSGREAKRAVGVSVSEWETESSRGRFVREGYRTDITGKPNFAIGQSLNGLKPFLSFICIYLQAKSSHSES